METLKVLLDISPQSWIVLWMQELCLLVFISPLLNTVSGIVKWSESHSVVSDSLPPYGLYSRGLLQARVLEWVAFLFSRGSSQPRDRTQIFRITGRFVSRWATGEAQEYWSGSLSLLQGSFRPRNWSGVSCIADGFFTPWAIREALSGIWWVLKCSVNKWGNSIHLWVLSNLSKE